MTKGHRAIQKSAVEGAIALGEAIPDIAKGSGARRRGYKAPDLGLEGAIHMGGGLSIDLCGADALCAYHAFAST
jgi:hypothetical protein